MEVAWGQADSALRAFGAPRPSRPAPPRRRTRLSPGGVKNLFIAARAPQVAVGVQLQRMHQFHCNLEMAYPPADMSCIRYIRGGVAMHFAYFICCGWESLMKNVTLGNVTMSHRTRERPAECLASLSHSTMIGLPRAQY
ncbi:hypothetical protein EVAR_68504_1 [Eumeta japonica]|uniref:Uncharacterized protein n=1 Tax=Eumeta variegata TaxID=151549 RepID=A0A4C2A8D9_EUMVA|nr:hypothetical protein EVAR_68504_1 [Eumeta japonica]